MGLILPQTITIKWHYTNEDYYKSKKYVFTKYNDSFEVDAVDLPQYSSKKVKCQCDYRKRVFFIKFFRIKFDNYLYKSETKTACSKCLQLKVKEINLERYGVEHTSQLDSVKLKTKNTNINRYGYIAPMGNENVKQKYKNTCMNKYGFDSSNKSIVVKDKIKNTMLKRYNVTAAAKNKEIYNKIKSTNIKKYGVDNPAKNDSIKLKAAKKWAESIYKNGTGPCSKQQKLIHELIGGELNYPVSKCLLDMAFPEEKIYVEYNGGGHNLSVKLGNITQEEFDKKELNRYSFLKGQGWKLIKINCNSDNLPSNQVIIDEIKRCKKLLVNSNSNWCELNW